MVFRLIRFSTELGITTVDWVLKIRKSLQMSSYFLEKLKTVGIFEDIVIILAKNPSVSWLHCFHGDRLLFQDL